MPEAALTGYSIAITRPVGQATRLSELIAGQGGKLILFPLIAIAPLTDYSVFEQKLTRLESYDWAIFISSNAVQNAMPRLLEKLGTPPENLRFAAIGPSTAAALTKFGVTATLIPEGRFDSESLLDLPEMQAVTHKHIMIFRGVGGREVLADTLKARGAYVDFAECYRRVNPQSNTDVLSSLWQNEQLDAVVVTSSEAMRYLLDITDHGDAGWLRAVTLCVNHARIAELPQQLGLKTAIADAPGDEAMLQCLIKALTHTKYD
ncbi:MAG: uroporphyrinogen-III synthase [Methylophilaceae bacterium]